MPHCRLTKSLRSVGCLLFNPQWCCCIFSRTIHCLLGGFSSVHWSLVIVHVCTVTWPGVAGEHLHLLSILDCWKIFCWKPHILGNLRAKSKFWALASFFVGNLIVGWKSARNLKCCNFLPACFSNPRCCCAYTWERTANLLLIHHFCCSFLCSLVYARTCGLFFLLIQSLALQYSSTINDDDNSW